MRDVLHFLNQRIDYERIFSPDYTAREFKPSRMRELLAAIGSPHLGMPILHVAGTKGKGSTSAMMAAILTAAGFRTGLFTSPHVERVEERVAIDGQPCSPLQFAQLLEQLIPAIEAADRRYAASDPPEPGPTYFEITTAMALRHFAQQSVDFAVLEVGLGGRLDSTNVCDPLVSIITSISFDHTKQLGNTLEAIAREKAGIIKPGVPVVSGVTEPGPREVIRQTCRDRVCRLVELGIDFDVRYAPPRGLESSSDEGRIDFVYRGGSPHRYSGVPLGLLGRHQAANAAVALAALAQLREARGPSAAAWKIPETAVRDGLGRLAWPARIELIARRPAVVIDAAHNVASAKALVEVLNESFAARRRILVFASTQEKDVPGMLRELLCQFDDVILTQYADNPRGVPLEDLAALAAEAVAERTERNSVGRDSQVRPGAAHLERSAPPGLRLCPSPAEAWTTARDLASPQDLICVTGSFYIAAQVRREALTRPSTGRAGL